MWSSVALDVSKAFLKIVLVFASPCFIKRPMNAYVADMTNECLLKAYITNPDTFVSIHTEPAQVKLGNNVASFDS